MYEFHQATLQQYNIIASIRQLQPNIPLSHDVTMILGWTDLISNCQA
jgi:hypothetical protein